MTLQLPTARRSPASGLLAGLVLAAAVAACGGASGAGNDGVVSLASPSAAPGASASPAASLDPEEAMAAFSACMKEHGVDVQVSMVTGDQGGVSVNGGPVAAPGGKAGAPQTGTGPRDPKALEEADKACRHLLPSGRLGDPNATIPPEQVEAMLGFAKCMREHGVDFPDPQFDGGGMTVQVGGPDGQGGVDPSSQTFQDAQAGVCEGDARAARRSWSVARRPRPGREGLADRGHRPRAGARRRRCRGGVRRPPGARRGRRPGRSRRPVAVRDGSPDRDRDRRAAHRRDLGRPRGHARLRGARGRSRREPPAP